MSGFKFQPIKKIAFPIVDENDTPIKEYTLDVGSDDFMRAVMQKGALVVQIAKRFTDANDAENTYPDLVEALRGLIDYAFGAGEYDFLYNKFGKNIFALIELSRAITLAGNGAMNERLEQNHALYG